MNRPEPPAVDLLSRPGEGRVHTDRRRVRLGDVDPGGRLRLDATARLLQDVATDDADDAGLDRRFGWLVRRTKIVTVEPPRLGEWLEVATWCSGIGRSWAERRTDLVGEKGGRVEAVSLWVQIDVASGRPAAIAEDFRSAYGPTGGDRRVSARLQVGGPDSEGLGDAVSVPWTVRRADLDPYGHVNNAATWAFVEEVVDLGDRQGTAELEYPLPLEPDRDVTALVARGPAGTRVWLLDGETVVAAGTWLSG